VANALDILRDILGFHQFTALLVHMLALIVRNVIEFEELLADIEVAPLDFALRIFDRARNQRMLYRFALFHAELLHQRTDTFGCENTHQIVFQRQVEAARTGVALPARPATQLIVDAARFVTLGTDDVQPTRCQHTVMTFLPRGLQRVDGAGVRIGMQSELRFEVTAEDDVGPATGHVGRDRDIAWTTGIGDDMCFALVKLCVQHLVGYPFLVQQARQVFRRFDRSRADQYRLIASRTVLDVFDDGLEFLRRGQIDQIAAVFADHRFMRRHDHHFETIDLLELVGFRVRRAGHA